MKIYQIYEGEKEYWTENSFSKSGFWSSFEPLETDKRNFFFLKAFILYLLMKMNGNKVKLEFANQVDGEGQ